MYKQNICDLGPYDKVEKNIQTSFNIEFDESQEKNLIESNKIISAFADYFKVLNIEGVASLLDDKKTFPIKENWRDEPKDVSKMEFINWLKKGFVDFKMENPQKTELSIEYDKCLFCDYGATVIFFENGKFPIFNILGMEKAGMRLKVENNKISELCFCGHTINGENRTTDEILNAKTMELYPDTPGEYYEIAIEKFLNVWDAVGFPKFKLPLEDKSDFVDFE